MTIKTRKKSYGFLFLSVSRTQTTGNDTQTARETEQADGSVDARLEPRPDIAPPAPFLFRTGPTINFIPGEDIKEGSKTIGAKLTVQVYKATGEPNNGKPLAVSVNQGRYTAASGLTTNTEGKVDIQVYKPDPEATEKQVVSVSVALGIVTGRMNVAI